MTRLSIDQLLAQPESKTLEFKRDLSSPRNLLKTLVAFANSAGGKLVVGVDDDRRVVGVADPLDAEERLCNLIADSISPRLIPNVEIASIGEHVVLVVDVFLSSARPHYLISQGADQGVYVRLGSSSRQADTAWVAEMRRTAEGIVFDETPMPEAGRDDLDLVAAQRCFGTGRKLDDQALITLKLLRLEQGRLVPTRGAILLFGKQREQYFPDAWTQCGRFRGIDKVEIFDQMEVHEHLPDAVSAIELFLKKHAFKSAHFGAMQRQDAWSIPLTLLREAIVNALVHGDYSQRGTPMRVAFFDDRIDIESPGLLLPGMTVEDMKTGISRIRNPVIARVFRELRLIEQWGSGVKRIFAEAAERGLPEPQIMETATGVRLRVFLGETHELGDAVTYKRAQVSEQVSEQVELLLRQCAIQPRSKQELLAAIGLSGVYMNYKRHIAPLVEGGLLALTIPDKPQSRLQKYRLTESGRRMLRKSS